MEKDEKQDGLYTGYTREPQRMKALLNKGIIHNHRAASKVGYDLL
jgi:hypothetical protein